MPRLSALVCAQNDEKRLAACLERLDFVDELVVVLDRCTGACAEIARRHADRVVSGAFPLQGSSRTAGIEACRGDWILEIDAGDQIGFALAQEIRDAIHGAIEADHFLLPIDHRQEGHLPAEPRLFRRGGKNRMHSGGELIHPLIRQIGDIFPDRLRYLWNSFRALPAQAAE